MVCYRHYGIDYHCVACKNYFLQKAAKEITNALAERLITDTNTLIDISSGDRTMRQLANSINKELRKLREDRHRFQQGDMELKNAIMNISHDLRTPLTAVCGYLDLLEQEEKSKNVERYIEVIRNRSEMLMQLTEELFRYAVFLSRGSNMVRESVAINRVLEESIAAFYTALNESGITPRIQMPKDNVIKMLDRSSLARVFSNLLNNVLSCKLDAPAPCRLDAPVSDVARWGSADCLHQHQQVI